MQGKQGTCFFPARLERQIRRKMASYLVKPATCRTTTLSFRARIAYQWVYLLICSHLNRKLLNTEIRGAEIVKFVITIAAIAITMKFSWIIDLNYQLT